MISPALRQGSSICSSRSAGFKGFEFLGDANAAGLNGQHRDDLHCEIWLSVEERERYLPVAICLPVIPATSRNF